MLSLKRDARLLAIARGRRGDDPVDTRDLADAADEMLETVANAVFKLAERIDALEADQLSPPPSVRSDQVSGR